MVSTISFGNFVTVGGKTISVGSQSGIDTEALINTLVDAKSVSVKKLTDDQTKIGSQVTAFGDLRALLSSVQTSLGFLRNPPGVGTASSNSFEFRTISLTTNDGTTASNYATATAAPGTNIGNYSLQVKQVAAARQDRTADGKGYTSKTADLTTGAVTAGTFQINGEDITVVAGDSLSGIANRINAKTGDTGVKASILQVASNDFRLVLTSTDTGTANDFTLTNADAIFGVGAFSTVQTARDAIFSVNGVEITRSSNQVDDAVDGVTFNLFQGTANYGLVNASKISVDVGEDVQTPFNQILSFVAAYNEAKIFFSKQEQRDDNGLPLDTAVLSNNSTLENIDRTLFNELTKEVSGLDDDALNKLADIGITFTDQPEDTSTDTPFTRNVLTVDQDKLLSALQTDFEGVRGIFEFRLTSDADDKIGVFSRTNALSIDSFSLDIDTSRAPTDRVRVTYDPGTGPVTINADLTGSAGSYKITGQDGTVLEGLELIYAGDGTDVINVNVSQGIADRLYNYTDATTQTDGTIDTEVASLNTSSDRLQDDIDRQNSLIDTFRNSLVDRFAALEEALSKVNSVLQFLDAQAQALQKANS
jgi:flagellar hook-associated protein 2